MTAEAAAHANEPPPAVSAVDPALPSALDPVLSRALAKRPEDRYDSCSRFVDDLRAALARSEAAPVAVGATPATTGRVVHRSRPRTGAAVGIAAVLLGAGAAGAWALAGISDRSGTATVVQTRTAQGETIVRTITESDTVTETTPPDEDDGSEGSGGQSGSGESGAELNDRGFRMLQAGDVNGALPLLEQAVAKLRGSSTLAEAYASYNLAVARYGVGRCDGVTELLDRSEEVQGKRKEITRLRRDVEKRCEG